MKKINLFFELCFSGLIVISGMALTSCNPKSSDKTIGISGAFALYPMAVKWADEYRKIHPEIQFNISAGGAGKGMTDALSNMVDLGMVSRTVNKEEVSKGAWPVGVVIDAVVPVMNSANPFIKEILARGITKNEFTDIYLTGKINLWSQLLNTKDPLNIVLYTRSDACGAAEVWAKYLGKKQENLNGVGVFGDPGIADAVKSEIKGVGYNNINYAYDNKTKKTHSGLAVIPIDLNKNGKIDADEDFYNTITDLIEAIRKGKYPSPPARELYFVSNGKPQNPEVIKFLKWILTDGQKYIAESGYVELSKDQIKIELDKIGK